MRKRLLSAFLCVLYLFLLPGCQITALAPTIAPTVTVPPTESQTEPPAPPTTAPPETTAPTEPVETEPVLEGIDLLLSQMTLRQKVGQLFIVRPDALDPGRSPTQINDTIIETLQTYPVGGIAEFAKNITGPDQLIAFHSALQAASAIPLFIAVDEEGGLVARLANHSAFNLPRYRNAAAVGSSGDPADALEMGNTIGAYLKQYGFNLDFAPVADVNTNPNNPVIGTRAFSSDPEIAAQMAAAMAEGLRAQGIIPTFKHFPGHGDTAQDSHYGLAITEKSQEEMEQCEWLPFLAAGSGDCIMVAHVSTPALTGDYTPATMSQTVITDILRGQLEFQGLVITDALEMGAITALYSTGEAAVTALLAGCDILLMPADLETAFEAVVAAVEDGTISPERLEESVRRVLEYKQALGLLPDV